jgi:DNA-binding HxlR family transcriptional regulator
MNDERFNKLEDSIDEIKTALIGNKSLGQKGIVERVVDNEKKTAQHERHNTEK